MFVFVFHTNYEKQNKEICFSYIEAQTNHFFAKSMQWRGSSSWHFSSCAEWAHLKPKHQTQCWWNLGISRVGPAARPGRLLLFTLQECTLHLALHLAFCFALCLLLHLALCLALHLALCLGEQDCVHIAHELDISYCTWHRGTIVSTPVGRHVSLIWEPA